MTPEMTPEITAFAADVLESIKQAKRYESAQIHALADIERNSFIEHLLVMPKTTVEDVAGFTAKHLEVQPRTIDLGDHLNHSFVKKPAFGK